MMTAPSKYHRLVYMGKKSEEANSHGYGYSWDSTHEELEPSAVIKINNTHFCCYCREKALPIQSLIRRYDDYKVTGHTCICEAAEAEKAYKVDKEELRSKHYREVEALKNSYMDALTIDNVALIKLKQENELKSAEREQEYRVHSFFSTLNGQSIYE